MQQVQPDDAASRRYRPPRPVLRAPDARQGENSAVQAGEGPTGRFVQDSMIVILFIAQSIWHFPVPWYIWAFALFEEIGIHSCRCKD